MISNARKESIPQLLNYSNYNLENFFLSNDTLLYVHVRWGG